MSIFDETLHEWVQVVDDKNDLTIEDYSYDTGIIGGSTENHCVKCVAVNQCYFKDELGKKPKSFTYTFEIITGLIKKLGAVFKLGLYHPFCYCKEIPIKAPKINDIKLIVPPGKIDWLFKDKMHM